MDTRKAPVVFFSLVFAALFAVVVWLAARVPGALLDLFERGHWLGPASDMLAGKIPYRDTFPIHGFLSDGGLDYLLFRITSPDFSTSVDARQLLGSFFQPALFLVAAAASRNVPLAVATVPLNLGMSTAILADRPVLPLLSLAAFAWAITEDRSRARTFFAGLLAAVGLLYALEFGIYVIAAEILTLAVDRLTPKRRRHSSLAGASYFLGLGAVLIPWFAFLAAFGALVPFLKVSFWDLPVRFHTIWPVHFPFPWEFLREWANRRVDFLRDQGVSAEIAKRLYLAPLLGVSGAVLAVLRRVRGAAPIPALRLLAVSLACAAFFRSVVARFHVEAGNALVGPVVFLALLTAFEAFGRKRRLAFLLAAVGVLAAFEVGGPGRVLALFRNAAQFHRRTAALPWTVPLTVARGGGMRVPRDEEQNLRALLDFTDRNVPPSASVLDLSNRASLYFFSQRVNPTRFYEVPPMAAFEDEVLEAIQRNPPALVYLQSGGWLDAIDGVPNSRRIPRVWSWVLRNYLVRVKVGDTTVALPRRNGIGLNRADASLRSSPSAPPPAGRSP
jgi:hypothetical protein